MNDKTIKGEKKKKKTMAKTRNQTLASFANIEFDQTKSNLPNKINLISSAKCKFNPLQHQQNSIVWSISQKKSTISFITETHHVLIQAFLQTLS
jgi:hypothetical protein